MRIQPHDFAFRCPVISLWDVDEAACKVSKSRHSVRPCPMKSSYDSRNHIFYQSNYRIQPYGLYHLIDTLFNISSKWTESFERREVFSIHLQWSVSMGPMPIGMATTQTGQGQNPMVATVVILFRSEGFVIRCLIHTLLELLFLKPAIDTTLTCLLLDSNALVTFSSHNYEIKSQTLTILPSRILWGSYHE
jgi:hypothetical protein